MKRAILEKASPLVKALCLLSLMLVCSIVSLLIYNACIHDTSTDALRLLQVLQSVCIFIVPCMVGAALWSQQPVRWLRLDSLPSLASVGIAVSVVVCAVPFINLLSHINQQITLPESLNEIEQWMRQSEEQAATLTEQFLCGKGYYDLFVNLLVMSVLPAFSEEIVFRGTLQPLFGEQRNRHCAVWCCAILFSAIHMQFYGFLPRMLMGVGLGYMVVWSGSLWLPILAHALNNALAVVTYFVCARGGHATEAADNFGTTDTLWVGVLSGVVTLILLYALRRSLTMSKASSRRASGN